MKNAKIQKQNTQAVFKNKWSQVRKKIKAYRVAVYFPVPQRLYCNRRRRFRKQQLFF